MVREVEQYPRWARVIAMATLRVLVADDHEIVRKGVCALITSHPGWEVCGEACDGREAVRKVAQLKPDIVILDIGMPSLNGLEATRQILHQNPRQRILILSITESLQTIHVWPPGVSISVC